MHVDTADASGEHASDAAPLHLKPAAGAGGGGSTRVRGGELHKVGGGGGVGLQGRGTPAMPRPPAHPTLRHPPHPRVQTRLSPAGDTLGVEYHHPSPDHVRVHGFTLARPSVDAAALDAAFDAGEGCRLSGWFLIQKVAGNLRFTPVGSGVGLAGCCVRVRVAWRGACAGRRGGGRAGVGSGGSPCPQPQPLPQP